MSTSKRYFEVDYRQKFKERREKWVAEGLCSLGDKRPAHPGKTICAVCIASKKAVRLETLANGKCTSCRQPNPNGQVKCDECKLRHLAYKFGISVEGCARLFDECSNRCSICQSRSVLVIDHDHKTGRVRGVLCKQCNIALGGVKDSEETLLKLVSYLKDPPAYKILADDVPSPRIKGQKVRRKRC